MDETRFGPTSPGQLVTIPEGGKAFVPEALPSRYEFDTLLWPLLAEAKAKVALLEGIGRNLPNPGILLRPLESREALQSSRLEGTYITAKEFLLFDLNTETESERRSDWREVHNCREALKFGQASELPLSLRLILDLHRILMQGITRSGVNPGRFRDGQVAIGSNLRFVPPPPHLIQEGLQAFEKYIHQSTPPDPLIHCFLCHYQFETIHPFSDGNGRVGRLLLALMLQQQCGLSKPWLYLSDVLERRREEYCDLLFEVSSRGAWTDWLGFCLRATIDQATETIERCDQLQNVRESIKQRVSECGGNVRLNQIVDQLFISPFIQVADLPEILGVTFPTARADCLRLEAAGILTQLSNVSPITYLSPEIFNVAYNRIGDD